MLYLTHTLYVSMIMAVLVTAFLRQQPAVLRRQTKTPRLTWRDRLSLLLLAPWVPKWKSILQIVTLFFQTVYAFVIIHLGSRRVVHVNATGTPPTPGWRSSCAKPRRLVKRSNT